MRFHPVLAAMLLVSTSSFAQQPTAPTPTFTGVNYVNVYGSDWLTNHAIASAVRDFANLYEDTERLKRAQAEAAAKSELLKSNYMSHDTYPEQIVDGWHNVIVTDNLNFCREAKVLVADNRITEFAIENCFRVGFTAAGQIRKAKNLITLHNFNSEELSVAEVYFVYDMDGPSLTSAPEEPGYVSFWTKKTSFLYYDIIINDTTHEGLKQKTKDTPGCGDPNTLTVALKPGTHTFRAMKSGNDLEGTLDIKPGQCLVMELD